MQPGAQYSPVFSPWGQPEKGPTQHPSPKVETQQPSAGTTEGPAEPKRTTEGPAEPKRTSVSPALSRHEGAIRAVADPVATERSGGVKVK